MGGGPSTPELIAAVANAGGLGSIAAGYLTADSLSATIDRTRQQTTGSLAINIFVPPSRPLNAHLGQFAAQVLSEIADQLGAPAPSATLPDATTFDHQVAVATDSDATFVSFTYGIPRASVISQLHAAGKTVAATANTMAEAEAVALAGCDAAILQGFEAGAHRGGLSERGDRHVGLTALLEQVRGRLGIDVIASGGVTSGAGVAACMALEAVAAQIGTAFLVSDESGATPEWKKAVTTSTDADTIITAALTGRGARGVRNELVDRLTELEAGPPRLPGAEQLHRSTPPKSERTRRAGVPVAVDRASRLSDTDWQGSRHLQSDRRRTRRRHRGLHHPLTLSILCGALSRTTIARTGDRECLADRGRRGREGSMAPDNAHAVRDAGQHYSGTTRAAR